jgi:hypothetical protein
MVPSRAPPSRPRLRGLLLLFIRVRRGEYHVAAEPGLPLARDPDTVRAPERGDPWSDATPAARLTGGGVCAGQPGWRDPVLARGRWLADA